MIAAHLEQISHASSLLEQYKCPHADCSCNQMTGQQHRVDRQNASEEEEAFQQSAERSYAPMHHLNLLSVGHPYS